MRLRLILFLLIVSLDSCVDPFKIAVNPGADIFVVDGLITDQPGPYTVKLSTSKPLDLNSQLYAYNWVTHATVIIHDDEGNQETLAEVSSGNYQTKIFQGVVGRSYFIEITTEDGKQFVSESERLQPVGDMADLRFRYEQGASGTADEFGVYTDTQFFPEQNGLVRWRWTGTFEIFTYPSLRTKYVGNPPVKVPDPIPCSGFQVVRNNLVQAFDCSCCDCWVTQVSDPPIISDERYVSDNQIINQKVATVPINRRTFFRKYHLEVEQMSVSRAVYNFWKGIIAQKKTGSDLFQTPPPKTSGNIKAVGSTSMQVIGIFGASSIKTKDLTILRTDVPHPLPVIDSLIASCLSVYPKTTNVRPSFW